MYYVSNVKARERSFAQKEQKMKGKKVVSLLAALCVAFSVCAFVIGCGDGTPKPHDHDFATEWTSDGEYHWHACKVKGCTEISGKAAHEWNDGTVTVQPTLESEGAKDCECTVCAKTATLPLDKILTSEELAALLENPVSDDQNITVDTTFRERSDEFNVLLSVCGDLCYRRETEGEDIIEKYGLKDGEKYYMFDNEGGEWSRVRVSEDEYNSLKSIVKMLFDIIRAPGSDNYTYDQTKQAYYYAGNGRLNDITMKIENGKITAYNCSEGTGNDKGVHTFKIYYTSDIEVPMDTNTVVTAEQWKTAMTDNLYNLNHKVTHKVRTSTRTSTITHVFFNDNRREDVGSISYTSFKHKGKWYNVGYSNLIEVTSASTIAEFEMRGRKILGGCFSENFDYSSAFESFEYNAETETYKCKTAEFDGKTNVEFGFMNGKLVSLDYYVGETEQHKFSWVYGDFVIDTSKYRDQLDNQ